MATLLLATTATAVAVAALRRQWRLDGGDDRAAASATTATATAAAAREDRTLAKACAAAAELLAAIDAADAYIAAGDSAQLARWQRKQSRCCNALDALARRKCGAAYVGPGGKSGNSLTNN